MIVCVPAFVANIINSSYKPAYHTTWTLQVDLHAWRAALSATKYLEECNVRCVRIRTYIHMHMYLYTYIWICMYVVFVWITACMTACLLSGINHKDSKLLLGHCTLQWQWLCCGSSWNATLQYPMASEPTTITPIYYIYNLSVCSPAKVYHILQIGKPALRHRACKLGLGRWLVQVAHLQGDLCSTCAPPRAVRVSQ